MLWMFSFTHKFNGNEFVVMCRPIDRIEPYKYGTLPYWTCETSSPTLKFRSQVMIRNKLFMLAENGRKCEKKIVFSMSPLIKICI